MNYYEHHLGDYDGATAHLSWVEDCAYRRLICLYYRSESPIPSNLTQACRLVRATSKVERDAVQQVLSEFFTETPDGWRHNRCDEEIGRYRTKSEKARANVSKRWEKRDADHVQTHNERNTPVHTPVDRQNVPPYYEGNTSRARPQTPDTKPQEEKPIGRAVAVNPATALPETTAPPLGRHEQFQRLRGAPVAMIPPDWQPSDTVRMRLVTAGCRQMEPEDVIRFVSHFTSTAEALADWDARAVNWMLDQRRIDLRTPQRSGGGEVKTSEQILAEFQAMVAEDDASEMQGARHAQR